MRGRRRRVSHVLLAGGPGVPKPLDLKFPLQVTHTGRPFHCLAACSNTARMCRLIDPMNMRPLSDLCQGQDGPPAGNPQKQTVH